MSVRAKFTVQAIERTLSSKSEVCTDKETCGVKSYHGSNGVVTTHYVPVELQTIKMNPVTSNDPSDENHLFWAATPSGSITLGVINVDAALKFDIGKAYYVDFTRAE